MSAKTCWEIIFNNYRYSVSASGLLKQANIQSLETRARINRLRNLNSFINWLFNVNNAKYIEFSKTGLARLNHRHNLFRYSFSPQAIGKWNSLPDEVATRPSLNVSVEAIISAMSKCS